MSLLACALLSSSALAQSPAPASTSAPVATNDRELNLTLTAGAIQSDNIGRVADGAEEDGAIGIAGVRLGYKEQTRRIESDIDLNAAYEHYFDDTFDGGILGGVNATVNFGVVPEKFLWSFRENFGQIDTNPFAAATPDNRENLNIFATGPDFFLALGDATSLKLSARHTDTDYETQNLDGQQNEGELSLIRRLSGSSTLSLVAQSAKFEFDDEVANPEYDRHEGLLRFEAQGSRTSLSVDGGYTAIDLDGETSDGLLARISLSRKTSPGATFSFSAGSEFSSAGDIFRLAQGADGVQLQPGDVVGTSDPFERRYAGLGYEFARNRTSFSLNAQVSKEEYETSTALDRDLTTYSMHFTRFLTAALSVRLFAALEQEEFVNLGVDDDEFSAGGSLDWSFGRTLSLRLQYDHFDRDSTNLSTEYTENRAALFVLWSPVQQQ